MLGNSFMKAKNLPIQVNNSRKTTKKQDKRSAFLFTSMRTIFISLIASLLCSCTYWDGRYQQTKFDIKFIDQNSAPIKGVMAKVYTSRKGDSSLYWPVTNYTNEFGIVSDASGIIPLYHIRSRRFEFGGWRFFVFGHSYTAKNYCKFYLNGKEIYKIRYDDLNKEFHKKIKKDSAGYYKEQNYVVDDFKWWNDSLSKEKFLNFQKTILIKQKAIK